MEESKEIPTLSSSGQSQDNQLVQQFTEERKKIHSQDESRTNFLETWIKKQKGIKQIIRVETTEGLRIEQEGKELIIYLPDRMSPSDSVELAKQFTRAAYGENKKLEQIANERMNEEAESCVLASRYLFTRSLQATQLVSERNRGPKDEIVPDNLRQATVVMNMVAHELFLYGSELQGIPADENEDVFTQPLTPEEEKKAEEWLIAKDLLLEEEVQEGDSSNKKTRNFIGILETLSDELENPDSEDSKSKDSIMRSLSNLLNPDTFIIQTSLESGLELLRQELYEGPIHEVLEEVGINIESLKKQVQDLQKDDSLSPQEKSEKEKIALNAIYKGVSQLFKDKKFLYESDTSSSKEIGRIFNCVGISAFSSLIIEEIGLGDQVSYINHVSYTHDEQHSLSAFTYSDGRLITLDMLRTLPTQLLSTSSEAPREQKIRKLDKSSEQFTVFSDWKKGYIFALLNNQAENLINSGNLNLAQSISEQLVIEFPDEDTGYALLAKIVDEKILSNGAENVPDHSKEEALELFQKAQNLSPNNPTIKNNIAVIEMRRGNYSQTYSNLEQEYIIWENIQSSELNMRLISKMLDNIQFKSDCLSKWLDSLHENDSLTQELFDSLIDKFNKVLSEHDKITKQMSELEGIDDETQKKQSDVYSDLTHLSEAFQLLQS